MVVLNTIKLHLPRLSAMLEQHPTRMKQTITLPGHRASVDQRDAVP
jgi:hypothetical protein